MATAKEDEVRDSAPLAGAATTPPFDPDRQAALARRGAGAPRPPSGRDDLTRVATLERRIGASLERVWENVLDWEHLPWLHRGAFADIGCTDRGEWGWRGFFAPRSAPHNRFDFELDRDVDNARYVSRTLSRSGPSSEIWTWLDPVDDDTTDIRVEFWMPGITDATERAMGDVMLGLYRTLWDEDEVMMRWRSARLADPADDGRAESIDLGPEAALRASLPRCFGEGRRRVRVVEIEGALHAHSLRCPHWLGPLDERPEGASDDANVRCPWHGYLFDVRSGRSSDGHGLKLPKPPAVRVDAASGHVLLEWPGRGEG